MAQAPLIPPNWDFPDFLRRRLGRNVGRQRLIVENDQLLIVAHEVPLHSSDTRSGILFWRDARREWHASNGDPGLVGIENLLSRYDKRIDEYDLAETKAQSAAEYLRVLEGLAPIARASSHLHTVLQEARRADPEESTLIDLRDQAYEQARTAELTYQYAKNEMDVSVVRRAEQQAVAADKMTVTAHRLNVMVALFFPIATLSGILGTTLTDNWSWSKSPAPFILFVLFGLFAGVVLTLFVGREGK